MTNLLPRNATKYEIGLDAEEDRVLSIPVPLRDLWNPAACPVEFLPFLAWGLGVDLWDSNWPEGRKRRMCASIIGMKRLKGTLEGTRQYLSFVDAEIVETVLPPQRIFALPYDPARRAAFQALFAQLRLYPYRLTEPADGPKLFLRSSASVFQYWFANYAFAMDSSAIQRYGVRAAIWDNGVETGVKWTGLIPGSPAPDIAIPTDEVIIPAAQGDREWTNIHAYAGLTWAMSQCQSRYLALSVDRSFSGISAPEIAPASDSLEVLSQTPVRVYDTYPASPAAAFTGSAYAGVRHYATAPDAPLHIYDKFYLFDKGRVPTAIGTGYGPFAGYMRTGTKPFTALFRIKNQAIANGAAIFPPRAYSGHIYAMPQTDRWTPIVNALNAASVYRDTLKFTTATISPIRFQDAPRFDAVPAFDKWGAVRVGTL